MRLSPGHQEAIVRAVADLCAPRARVLLFGSRTDDSQRGGDVDLLVTLPEEPADRARIERALYGRIVRALNGRSVDLLLLTPSSPSQEIHKHALATGVPL